MKRTISALVMVIAVALGIFSLSRMASAEEIKMVGVITKIEIAGEDANTAAVTLKDNKSGELVVIVVNDDLTLDKFKDHRIVDGDEIRCKYEPADGKNISKIFRKTAGC